MYPTIPTLLTMGQARSRLSQFLEAKTDAAPETVRSRKVKNQQGELVVQHYAVGGHAISDGAEKTGWAIARLALKSMARMRRAPALDFEDHCVSSTLSNVPPVSTNCQELCKAVNRGKRVSDRTVRNHIRELMKVGVILKKKFRGTKANFLLWINPVFLVEIGVEMPPPHQQQKAQNPSPEAQISTIFPLIEEVLVNLKETEIDNVDKLVLHEAPADGERFNFREERGVPEKKKATGGAGAAPGPRTVGEILSGQSVAQASLESGKSVTSDEARKLVEEFVFYAWPKLYTPQGVTFNEAQTREFKNAVWAGVYNRFPNDWPRAEVLRYHAQALERVKMAARYFDNNPGKYPPLPYAEFRAGSGYFDADNQYGFAKTMDWLIENYAKKLKRKIGDRIKLARREWRRCLLGNDPGKRTMLQVYRYHEHRLSELGEHALQRFHATFRPPIGASVQVMAVQD